MRFKTKMYFLNSTHSGRAGKGPPLKTIIDNSSGCVNPGEMLLVLGTQEPDTQHYLAFYQNIEMASQKLLATSRSVP
jgi:hypothetical protein